MLVALNPPASNVNPRHQNCQVTSTWLRLTLTGGGFPDLKTSHATSPTSTWMGAFMIQLIAPWCYIAFCTLIDEQPQQQCR